MSLPLTSDILYLDTQLGYLTSGKSEAPLTSEDIAFGGQIADWRRTKIYEFTDFEYKYLESTSSI